MNLKQLAYQYGRLKNSNPHIICPALTGISSFFLGESGIRLIRSGSIENFVPPLMFTFLSVYYSSLSVLSIKAKGKLNKIKKDKEFCSGDDGSIILDDRQGLEMLLEKTAKSKRREWGTVLNVHKDKNRAVINKILTPESAKGIGLIKVISNKMLWINHKLMEEKGYRGMHHYHTNKFFRSCGAVHYAINLVDRAGSIGLTNLLTFNLPGGPEIIGYDPLYTYIPADKSKQTLVKAAPEDIMNYLR